MNEAVRKTFEQIKIECRPNKDKPFLIDVFDMFFGQIPQEAKHNFIGGINDDRNTLHENMFQALFPHLIPQVHFGTGKGGYEKYWSKRFTADFFDEDKNIIYEIDGRNHETELQYYKDKIRDAFFMIEHGIKTVRYTNEQVEQMVINRLVMLDKEGKLDV